MEIHPNAKLAEEAWDAVSRSDVVALRRYYDETIWHVHESSPLAGDRVGADEILDYFAQLGESSDEYRIRLEDILANDNYVVMLTEVSTEQDGRSVDIPFVLLGKVRDHRIAEVWSLPAKPGAVSGLDAGRD
jgi:ketosteroid isomerase-like protein